MNHTQLPNEIIDVHMKNLSHISFKVVVVICRKTFGWHKETDSISLSQIQELTGLSRNSVLKSINELETLGIIIVDRVTDKKTTNKYTINYEAGTGEIPHKSVPVHDVNMGGACREPGGGACREHTKDILLNKNKINISYIKDEELFNKFWEEYDRKKNKINSIKEWNKLSPEERLLVIKSLPIVIKQRPDVTFRTYPERYFRNKLFNDFLEEDKPKRKFVDQYNK